MQLDVADITREQAAAIYPTLLTPRPVVLIGTMDEHRGANIAPYSSISLVANHPPLVAVSFSRPKEGGEKDTLRLALATGELVVNLLSRSHAEAALEAARSRTAMDTVDDYARLQLARADFAPYPAGRIADAPAALGCTVTARYDLPPSSCTLLVAELKAIYLSEAWREGGEHAACVTNLLAGVAAEEYIGLAGSEQLHLPRTWD